MVVISRCGRLAEPADGRDELAGQCRCEIAARLRSTLKVALHCFRRSRMIPPQRPGINPKLPGITASVKYASCWFCLLENPATAVDAMDGADHQHTVKMPWSGSRSCSRLNPASAPPYQDQLAPIGGCCRPVMIADHVTESSRCEDVTFTDRRK